MISTKHTQKKQERSIAALIGGRRTPLSGASDYAKGDAKGKVYLAEAKETAKGSYSLKQAILAKIDQEAMAQDRYPMLTVRFLNMPPLASKDWVMVPKYVFEALLSQLEEAEGAQS